MINGKGSRCSNYGRIFLGGSAVTEEKYDKR